MNSLPISPSVNEARVQTKGFTLVEMLVAVAVLTMMMVMMGQIAGMVNQAWSEGRKKVNNFTKARAMLDLFSRDIQSGVFRNDLAFFPNSEIAFYTQQPGILSGGETARDVSLVHYVYNTELHSSIGVSTLQRKNLAISWGNRSASSISFGNTATLPNLAQTIEQDVAPGVIGYKAIFIYSDGTLSPFYRFNPENPLRAVGLTLAVVDDQTLLQLDVEKIKTLRSALGNHLVENHGIKASWEDYLKNHLQWSAYPKSLGTGLKIFERYVTLPTL